MARRKKTRKPKVPAVRQRTLKQDEINIAGEADYIIRRAQDFDPRVVTLDPLVFFSTETGDAWMLDPEDHLALCLARQGEKQPFTIMDTPTSFVIEWNAHYDIAGDAFTVIDASGHTRTIQGYPTIAISEAVRRLT